MNTITRKCKECPEGHGRFKHPKIDRDRATKVVKIARDLSDRSVFPRVHRFGSDPMRFAIHSHIPLGEHGLLEWEGTVYKIAAIDRYEIGTLHGSEYYYEVKTLIWSRYQSK